MAKYPINKESQDILIAWIVLSLLLSRLQLGMMLISFIAVGTAFVCHELAHRYVARRNNLHAEFKIWEKGLMIAVLLAFMSQGQFIFAAPGAVYISGYYITKEENGKISFAGPMTNLIFATISLIIYSFTPSLLISTLATINGYFALFNLMPIPPLDGSKIKEWNNRTYILSLIWAAIIVILIEYLIF